VLIAEEDSMKSKRTIYNFQSIVTYYRLINKLNL